MKINSKTPVSISDQNVMFENKKNWIGEIEGFCLIMYFWKMISLNFCFTSSKKHVNSLENWKLTIWLKINTYSH